MISFNIWYKPVLSVGSLLTSRGDIVTGQTASGIREAP